MCLWPWLSSKWWYLNNNAMEKLATHEKLTFNLYSSVMLFKQCRMKRDKRFYHWLSDSWSKHYLPLRSLYDPKQRQVLFINPKKVEALKRERKMATSGTYVREVPLKGSAENTTRVEEREPCLPWRRRPPRPGYHHSRRRMGLSRGHQDLELHMRYYFYFLILSIYSNTSYTLLS